jgi:hypothetical protein
VNAHCERVIGTLRRELLDHALITSKARARHFLKTYQEHYKRHRPPPSPRPATTREPTTTHRSARPRHPQSAPHAQPDITSKWSKPIR